jgi:hypothetical protein
MHYKILRGPSMQKFTLLLSFVFVAQAQAVTGDMVNYKSPNGVLEACVAITKAPGVTYSAKDIEKENELCSINIYNPVVAICPKTFSTSAGTLAYDITANGVSQDIFEGSQCKGQSTNAKKLGKFKTTMNAPTTSGTFSTSSLLYYHTSRYLNMGVTVPVAVYRTFDRQAHFKRVTEKTHSTGMNGAAWDILRASEQNPSAYNPIDELFTPDRQQIYGVILRDKGERYGAEFNGTRASGWGVGQNNDFQKTAGFLALRKASPLAEAMTSGVAQARQDAKMKAALGASVNDTQMIFWMKDVIEITLLDYIFSQQDRIGNIDYQLAWVWVQDGRVKSRFTEGDDVARSRMSSVAVPADIAAFKPVLIQKTSIGDNDAGGKPQYANFTKKTNMLSNLKHYSADTYLRLKAMVKDFQAQGPIYAYYRDSFGLTSSQLQMIVKNAGEAYQLISADCKAGMRFDVDPFAYVLKTNSEQQVSCD